MDGRGWSIELQQGRLIAIGDIHGCVEALNGLLHWVTPHRSTTHFIILGDVVDRGLSARVASTRDHAWAKFSSRRDHGQTMKNMMLTFSTVAMPTPSATGFNTAVPRRLESYGNVRKMMLEMPSVMLSSISG